MWDSEQQTHPLVFCSYFSVHLTHFVSFFFFFFFAGAITALHHVALVSCGFGGKQLGLDDSEVIQGVDKGRAGIITSAFSSIQTGRDGVEVFMMGN